jgi:lipoate-protein ligase A
VSQWRLIVDPPAAGAWNMAVDEVLLDWAAASGGCCLRLYRWEEATLSLGYFQQYADRAGHAPSLDCPVVRRASGGGAILHDADWTYSVALSASHPLAVHRLYLYRAIHTALVDLLAEYGLRASLCSPSDRGPTPAPFLCFQRRSEGDVLVAGHKVAGSAQRRREGAVLQHGSVLLARSPAAPELHGVKDLLGTELDESRFGAEWLQRLTSVLNIPREMGSLTDVEKQQAQAIVALKYGCSEWTRSRGR